MQWVLTLSIERVTMCWGFSGVDGARACCDEANFPGVGRVRVCCDEEDMISQSGGFEGSWPYQGKVMTKKREKEEQKEEEGESERRRGAKCPEVQ